MTREELNKQLVDMHGFLEGFFKNRLRYISSEIRKDENVINDLIHDTIVRVLEHADLNFNSSQMAAFIFTSARISLNRLISDRIRYNAPMDSKKILRLKHKDFIKKQEKDPCFKDELSEEFLKANALKLRIAANYILNGTKPIKRIFFKKINGKRLNRSEMSMLSEYRKQLKEIIEGIVSSRKDFDGGFNDDI